jgi:hypothetical protein
VLSMPLNQPLTLNLKRNLAINGGILDEVIFAVNTNNEGDLKYLDELVALSPKYRKHVPTPDAEYAAGSYGSAWEPVEHGNIYIKIDDDVVGGYSKHMEFYPLILSLALHRR